MQTCGADASQVTGRTIAAERWLPCFKWSAIVLVLFPPSAPGFKCPGFSLASNCKGDHETNMPLLTLTLQLAVSPQAVHLWLIKVPLPDIVLSLHQSLRCEVRDNHTSLRHLHCFKVYTLVSIGRATPRTNELVAQTG